MRGTVVFDIGGTYIRTALYIAGKDTLKDLKKFPAPSFLNIKLPLYLLQESLLQIIIKSTMEIKNDNRNITVDSLGIAFPGPVSESGDILKAPTLWGEMNEKYELGIKLKTYLPELKVFIINDITAAGFRYLSPELNTFCIITISSGVGSKVFWNGEVLLNKGLGGEIGHHFFGGEYEHFPCDCGGSGHIGAIASGRGFEALFRFLSIKDRPLYEKSLLFSISGVSTPDIIKAIHMNDEFALKILTESVKPIASAISSVFTGIGINRFIIIGGAACAIGSRYTDLLITELHRISLFGLEEDDYDSMVKLGFNDDLNGLAGVGKYVNDLH
jgi:C7-cyclitol 7-kinase